ncbi:MAG TPA: hypothetical protein VME22_24065 [Solirubrobacteraceae bacterium]|nr:hypothetical protein [Solirubrobacteraceae bacterium]
MKLVRIERSVLLGTFVASEGFAVAMVALGHPLTAAGGGVIGICARVLARARSS